MPIVDSDARREMFLLIKLAVYGLGIALSQVLNSLRNAKSYLIPPNIWFFVKDDYFIIFTRFYKNESIM